VPIPVLKQRLGPERIMAEAVDSHISGWFWNAAARARIRPVAQPQYDYELPVAEDADWRFTATVPVQPKVDVVDWTELEVGKPEAEVPEELVDSELDRIRDSVAELVPVDGRPAQPGDTLVVDIEEIELVGLGGQGIIPDFGILEWDRLPLHFFEPRDGRIQWLRGIEFEVRPNLGVIGVAPREGAIPSIWPGDHGGNQDTKYVCAGSRVFLPVFHPGALLFLGDCHQIQGDGELCGVAPETDADVTIRVDVVKGKAIPRPRILAAERFMNLASAETLEEAVKIAVRDAIDMLVTEKGFTEDEAYLLITVKADIEICQVVDPLMTVRVAMDRAFWEELDPA
jgi:amidase